MKKLFWAEWQKLRRSNVVFMTIFAAVMIAGIVFIGGQTQDFVGMYMSDPGGYMTMTQSWATLFAIPAVIALMGSYMICREVQDDTLKSLKLIPVSEKKLTAVKLCVTLIFSIMIYMLLFVITFFTEAVIHFGDLSVKMVWDFGKTYVLEGIGTFLAVSPIVAIISYTKKSYWLALVLAEIYSFTGIFMSMSNTLRTIYPISAVLGACGYYETTIRNRIASGIVLILCGCFSVFILIWLDGKHSTD